MIDIRIFTIPERLNHAKEMQKILNVPDKNCIIDYNHDGVIPTAKKAWLIPTDCDYVMVLNDDLIFCDNFLHICNQIVKSMPDCIISLFPLQFQQREVLSHVGGIPKNSPYVTTDILSGCGIIMPTRYVKPCIESWRKDAVCDDTSIHNWARANNITVITTLPTTIQHVGYVSVARPGGNYLKTDFFEQSPVANWESTYLTSWTSLIRQ